MSSIEKLSIQGIRSFGSNAEDRQEITFSSPVTLILGQNGCGKTTIIECLKHALTGEFPPGSDKGKNFVHDPKIFGLNESLGQVKIQVRDKRGAQISVCRTMKVAYKNGKPSFGKMDSTVNFLSGAPGSSSSGNLDSLSGRTVDINVTISDFMGVSEAIINNVLLCHQEDSSWPLDEAKKLKEKFDAIFGITEYNKALDKIIKMRKEAKDALKVMEAGMKHIAYLKQEMEAKSLNLQKAEEKCEDIKSQCQKCEDDMKPVDERLLEIRKIEFEVGKYQAQQVEMETKHKNCKEQINTISKKIKTLFEGSLAELDLEIRNFDQRMSEIKYQRSDFEEQLSKLTQSEGDLQKALTSQEKKRLLAQQQQQSEQTCKAELVKRLKDLSQQLLIPIEGDLSKQPEKLSELLEDIEGVLLGKQCEIAEESDRNDKADQGRQLKIDELRIELSKSEQQITAQEKQKVVSEKESGSLEVKIKQIETSMHQLKLLEKQITEADEVYERTSRNFNQEACRQVIADKKSSIAEKQERFKKLDKQLTFLSSMSKLMAEINLKEKDLEKKTQEIQRVRNRHSENFSKFFKEPITNNYRRSLQNSYDSLRREIRELNEKANAQKLKEQSCEIKRKNIMSDISRMEKELKEAEELIYQKCHSTPYEELLERSKANISKLQFEHGALTSAEAMYKKYIQKITEEPCCPLCHHNMSGDEASDLSYELTDEIEKLPENIERASKALKAEQLKYENLLQIRPSITKVTELKKTIPEKKEELHKIEELLGDSVSEYETMMALIAEPTQNMELANSMLGDMSLLDEALKESVRVKRELEQAKSKLPDNYDSSVSMEALQNEKSEVSKELDTERKTLESSQHNFEQQMEALNRLREVKNALKDKQIKLQEGVQSLPQLKDRLDELTRQLVAITTEISELKSKIQPLKQKLASSIQEKSRLKEQDRAKLNQLTSKLNSYKSADQDIQRLNTEALDYAKLDIANAIKKHDSSINAMKEDLTKLDSEIKGKTKELEAIKMKCANQQTVERDLRDNRELKQLQEKEVKLSENCKDLNRQLGNLDFGGVSKEKQELAKQRDAATVRKGELLGQLGEINSQVQKLQREINEPKYKESLKNYRKANFELHVTRRSIEDLGQHRLALEWALIQFHSEKMEKINRLIREYWRMVYRGNDIDYIEVKTEDDKSKGIEDGKNKDTLADRRKSYNYRVIQSKNNNEIEMRGRCSAGQRVLASLIIRMALAETFSSNCAVLALDEPTTNLDRVNIISLCDALNRIVDERESHANFMLIIITHDENFISSMGKLSTYHRVYRNDETKSVIRKVNLAE
ncbi:uncharacterized protein Dwil_GK20820 [Drosophila willistoni]|uniref:Zinc-hook domain-containing protein n=1 Tax=Drosophila willistoni TaxID=7260 RepID=B4MJF7_DROWI|nr:DNA repair protein RAD50 [Drosophila willistoni]EDW72246.1 uncharacterized protein Dwil_GK20820 [Drosophila willistoni]